MLSNLRLSCRALAKARGFALIAILGPLIKRYGKSYAADVFRVNPRTGKSYLVLTDVAYYLIFTAFILFTVILALTLLQNYVAGRRVVYE